MKKYASVKFLSLALVLLLFGVFFAPFPSVTASADTGPKPSVTVTFENMGDELCYGTLLSYYPSTGPNSVWDGDPETAYYNEAEYDIWKAFVDYKDADGYYFLQAIWKCNATKQIDWTYYPPSPFKILLYYPESGDFSVSDAHETYAFHSYFSVETSDMQVKKSYDYTWEIVSLLCRIVVTVALEMGVALLFRIRERKHLLTILCTNAVTQIILNVALNLINFHEGNMTFVLFYILFELIVFVIEAAVYAVALSKIGTPVPVWKSTVYALTANAVSFLAGLALAIVIPGIF